MKSKKIPRQYKKRSIRRNRLKLKKPRKRIGGTHKRGTSKIKHHSNRVNRFFQSNKERRAANVNQNRHISPELLAPRSPRIQPYNPDNHPYPHYVFQVLKPDRRTIVYIAQRTRSPPPELPPGYTFLYNDYNNPIFVPEFLDNQDDLRPTRELERPEGSRD